MTKSIHENEWFILEARIYGAMAGLGRTFHPRDAENITTRIKEHFIVIDRAELPETTVKDGHVDVAGADSQWSIKSVNLDLNRKWALQYLAAGEAVAKARAEGDAKLNGRRNALSIDFGLHAPYDALPVSHQRMIDYIIKLEGPKIIESEDQK